MGISKLFTIKYYYCPVKKMNCLSTNFSLLWYVSLDSARDDNSWSVFEKKGAAL